MEIKIRIAGAAGQGIQTTAELLARILLRTGLHVLSYSDAESRIRGGLNFSHIRASDEPVIGISQRFDILLAQSPEAVRAFSGGISNTGVLIGFSSSCDEKASPLDLDELAKRAGNLKASGVVGVGAICSLLKISRKMLLDTVKEHFKRNSNLVQLNVKAIQEGYDAVVAWKQHPEHFAIEHVNDKEERLLVYGHQAISLGAIAGGVSFVAGYPMSPATSILTDLATWSEQTGIVVEQAEDEIAAINMLAGASFSGARSMTATSGGGFCLMTEGVSLLGMIETPGVIVVAQRPGPATGLPTRTAQGDLNLVLHAGHGFFPRLIFAPATVEDGFEMTARAFDLAERFGVVVFILTDQLLQDSQSSVESFETRNLPRSRHLLSKEKLSLLKSYDRFLQTSDGVSPQAAPGSSRHVVVVDSDEHDERGHLTESRLMSQKMSKKRIRKAQTIHDFSWFSKPILEGFSRGAPLVISWGSTYGTICEIRKTMEAQNKKFSHLHLRQLWPLDERHLVSILDQASHITVVENNTDGQLADLLKKSGLRSADNLITRHDGRPFSVEDLTDNIQEVLK